MRNGIFDTTEAKEVGDNLLPSVWMFVGYDPKEEKRISSQHRRHLAVPCSSHLVTQVGADSGAPLWWMILSQPHSSQIHRP